MYSYIKLLHLHHNTVATCSSYTIHYSVALKSSGNTIKCRGKKISTPQTECIINNQTYVSNEFPKEIVN